MEGVGGLPPVAHAAVATQELVWAGALAYEMNNAQRLDDAALAQRVQWLHESRVCYLHRHPIPWLEYARWHVLHGHVDAVLIGSALMRGGLARAFVGGAR